MPIKVPDNLPAQQVLKSEGIFVMNESRAYSQDIRPLKIAVLNLMPNKEQTEVQLLRLLGNTPLQVDIRLIFMKSHTPKNTSIEHLSEFYKDFDQIRHDKFDGMIITGAPIEMLEFEEVTYWNELKEIMAWTKVNVTSTLHICWGAQAGLYYHYGINKLPLSSKSFGVFPHTVLKKQVMLFQGFDDIFYAPHSRHTTVLRDDIIKNSSLELLSESEEAGVYIVMSKDGRQIFVTGHSEYDPLTLKDEYDRDTQKGENIQPPKYYFPDDDDKKLPIVNWRAHSNLFFQNWLNYYVYQITPYNLNEIN